MPGLKNISTCYKNLRVIGAQNITVFDSTRGTTGNPMLFTREGGNAAVDEVKTISACMLSKKLPFLIASWSATCKGVDALPAKLSSRNDGVSPKTYLIHIDAPVLVLATGNIHKCNMMGCSIPAVINPPNQIRNDSDWIEVAQTIKTDRHISLERRRSK